MPSLRHSGAVKSFRKCEEQCEAARPVSQSQAVSLLREDRSAAVLDYRSLNIKHCAKSQWFSLSLSPLLSLSRYLLSSPLPSLHREGGTTAGQSSPGELPYIFCPENRKLQHKKRKRPPVGRWTSSKTFIVLDALKTWQIRLVLWCTHKDEW